MSIPTDFLPSFYANQTIALIASPQPFRVYHRQKQNAYYQHHRLDHRQERRKTGAYRALCKLINVHADLHENSAYSQRISERPLKETIAHRFGLTMNRGPEILGQYMHSMTIIRNLCAHGSRIYNRLFEQKPSLNKKEQALLIRREDGTMDNSHFFGFFLIMRRLLPAENFAEMKEAVIALTEKYPFVRMDYYGFRDDWKEKL